MLCSYCVNFIPNVRWLDSASTSIWTTAHSLEENGCVANSENKGSLPFRVSWLNVLWVCLQAVFSLPRPQSPGTCPVSQTQWSRLARSIWWRCTLVSMVKGSVLLKCKPDNTLCLLMTILLWLQFPLALPVATSRWSAHFGSSEISPFMMVMGQSFNGFAQIKDVGLICCCRVTLKMISTSSRTWSSQCLSCSGLTTPPTRTPDTKSSSTSPQTWRLNRCNWLTVS